MAGLNGFRGFLYGLARLLGDVNAVEKHRIQRRVDEDEDSLDRARRQHWTWRRLVHQLWRGISETTRSCVLEVSFDENDLVTEVSLVKKWGSLPPP